MGGRGTVVRSRRQVWTLETARGGGEVDVVLGVNGFVWVCKHVGVGSKEGEGGVGVNRIEEVVGEGMYERRNESIGWATRREIARLVGAVGALVEGGCRVDEDMVGRAYEAALEVEGEEGEDGEGGYLGGEVGRRVVERVLEGRE